MKYLKYTAALAVIPLALAACSSSSDDGDTKSIDLWTSWTPGAATDEASQPLFDEFEEETGYTINQSNFTNDQLHEKLIASAAGGNLPDVVWGLPEYIAEFNQLGILEDLTDDWESWEYADKVADNVKQAMTVDGKVLGMPFETAIRAYLVHDSTLGTANVSVPETWDDVLAVGSTVEDATQNSFYGVAATGARAPQELMVYLAQVGLQVADEQEDGSYRNTWQDSPEALAKATKVFQFYNDLFDSGAVNLNSATYGWEQTDENFATGLTATYVSGNWLAEREEVNPDTMGDVSIHPIPHPDDGVQATYLESKPVFVMTGSDVRDGAVELAQFMAGEEYQSSVMADRSALSDVSTDSKWSQDFKALIDTGVSWPPVSLGGVTQAMIDALANVLQEGDSPEDAAVWLSDAINAALEKSGDLNAG